MVSESSFLSRIIPKLSEKNLLPGNDDAVAWKTPEEEKNSLLVLNTDSISWSTDALPLTMSLFDFGVKLVTVTVSDIIAKGSKPYYFLSTIVVPTDISEIQLEELFNGLEAGCKKYNLEYMGGDLGNSKEIVLTGIIVGYAKEEQLRRRSAVQDQDLICSTGYFGYTGLGFLVYLEQKPLSIPSTIMDLINKKLMKPEARLDWLVLLQKYVHATVDSSDGLLKSLQLLANESQKQIRLETLPAFTGLEKILPIDSNDYLKAILSAGEEFEIIFSISKENYDQMIKNEAFKDLPKPVVIGRASKGSSKVFYKKKELNEKNNWDSFHGFVKQDNNNELQR